MPIKQASFKHWRQTKKRTVHNRQAKNQMKNLVKQARQALELKDKSKSQAAITKAIKVLDKAAQHKLIKPNKAARLKSRLMKHFHKLS